VGGLIELKSRIVLGDGSRRDSTPSVAATAMKMVGHKTQSIYSRYAIVDEGMVQDGAKKLAVAIHA
jgi:hypothetical protein